MTDRVVKTIEDPAGKRRVEIFQRANGTFGFEHWIYGEEEGAWYPIGGFSSFTDTLERAEAEARGRVSWLRSI